MATGAVSRFTRTAVHPLVIHHTPASDAAVPSNSISSFLFPWRGQQATGDQNPLGALTGGRAEKVTPPSSYEQHIFAQSGGQPEPQHLPFRPRRPRGRATELAREAACRQQGGRRAGEWIFASGSRPFLWLHRQIENSAPRGAVPASGQQQICGRHAGALQPASAHCARTSQVESAKD